METTTDRTKDAMDALAAAISTGMRAGRDFFDAVLGPATEALSAGVGSAKAFGSTSSGCSCDIPDPCWMPERLPAVRSNVCAGATARVRIRVTNCGLDRRQVILVAQGTGAAAVQIEPKLLSLAPFESGEFTASVTVPGQGGDGVDVRLWVRGCKDHVVPWTVSVSDSGCSCLHEIALDDCPDLVHHWYDHFYCQSPCYGGRARLDG